MSYEELEPAQYEWKQYAITINPDINFDDFREVQRYLRIKRAVNKSWERINRHLSENQFSGGLNALIKGEI